MVTDQNAPVDDISGRTEPSWSALLAFGLATRVIVVVLGCVIGLPASPDEGRDAAFLGEDGMTPLRRDARDLGCNPWIEPWYHWDATWYADIAERGYSYQPGTESSVVFMPMLPLLIRAGGALGLDRCWAGLAIPNLAFAVGLALFARCAFRVTRDTATTWRACILLAAFPTSFFFSAPYQESLTLALTAASLLAWLTHHPGRSAAALAAASATRITALSMSVGLVLEWAGDVVRGRAARHSAWFVAIAGTAGLALFLGYLATQFHDPLVTFKVQTSWHRKPPSVHNLIASFRELGRAGATIVRRPEGLAIASILLLAWPCRKLLHAVGPTLPRVRHPGWIIAASVLISIGVGLLVMRDTRLSAYAMPVAQRFLSVRDSLAAIAFLGLGIHTFWRRGPLWGCLVVIPVLQALATGSTMSMMRIALCSYPAFVSAAELTSNPAVFAVTVVICLWAQFIMLALHVNGVFVA
jgi:Mannosyltransferase (PIG-V)